MQSKIVKNVIIVTGGFVEDKLFLEEKNKYPDAYLIGVDKGIECFYRNNISPDLILGDFDSIDAQIKEQYFHNVKTIKLKPEKDYTDTHSAVLEALKLEPENIFFFGATGSRIDHTMANINMLKLCLKEKVNGFIVDGNNRIRMIDKQCRIVKKEAYGPYISCIPFSDKVTGINLSGFKYPLTDATMIKEDSLGISNEIREEEGLIAIDTGYLLVMETKD